eukprot:jgi/Galph1/3375/GphlegSOOS_G2027.1
MWPTSQVPGQPSTVVSWLFKLQSWWKERWSVSRTPSLEQPPPVYCQQIVQVEEKIWKTHMKLPYERHFVCLFNGEYINTVVAGDPSNPCLVVTPGYCSGVGVFARNLEALAERYRVFCVDWLGCGASSKPKFPAKCKVEEAESFFVDSLEQWRIAMGKELERPFILMGHSLGGYLAAVYAMKYPQQVKKLVLVSPVGVPPAPVEVDDQWNSPKQLPSSSTESTSLTSQQQYYRHKYRHVIRLFRWLWKHDVTPHLVLRTIGPYFGRGLTLKYANRRFQHCLSEEERQQMGEYIYEMCVKGPLSGEYALNAILLPGAWAKQPLSHRWEQLKVNSIFLYGEHDWMDYHVAESLQQQYTSIEAVKIVKSSGHYLFLENPCGFHEQLFDALQ